VDYMNCMEYDIVCYLSTCSVKCYSEGGMHNRPFPRFIDVPPHYGTMSHWWLDVLGFLSVKVIVYMDEHWQQYLVPVGAAAKRYHRNS